MIIYIVFFDEQGKNLLFLITFKKKMTEEATNNDNEFDTIPKLMLYHARERGIDQLTGKRNWVSGNHGRGPKSQMK